MRGWVNWRETLEELMRLATELIKVKNDGGLDQVVPWLLTMPSNFQGTSDKSHRNPKIGFGIVDKFLISWDQQLWYLKNWFI